MKILFHKNFKKRYEKLTLSEQGRFKERRDLFLQNPFYPSLKNHALHGAYKGCRSINITGDLRVIYEEISPNIIYFIALNTHSELYE